MNNRKAIPLPEGYQRGFESGNGAMAAELRALQQAEAAHLPKPPAPPPGVRVNTVTPEQVRERPQFKPAEAPAPAQAPAGINPVFSGLLRLLAARRPGPYESLAQLQHDGAMILQFIGHASRTPGEPQQPGEDRLAAFRAQAALCAIMDRLAAQEENPGEYGLDDAGMMERGRLIIGDVLARTAVTDTRQEVPSIPPEFMHPAVTKALQLGLMEKPAPEDATALRSALRVSLGL